MVHIVAVVAGFSVNVVLHQVHNDHGGPPGPAHHVDTGVDDAITCMNNKTDQFL